MVQIEHELQFSLRVEPRLARAGDGLGLFARHAQRGAGRARGDLLRRVLAVEDGAADGAEVAQRCGWVQLAIVLLRLLGCTNAGPAANSDRYVCTIASQNLVFGTGCLQASVLLDARTDPRKVHNSFYSFRAGIGVFIGRSTLTAFPTEDGRYQ